VPAMGATDARAVELGLTILNGHWRAAGVALVVITGAQIMLHSDAVIEDETVALPLGLLLRHFFEVFEDAALEVEHLFKAFAEHIARGFFTANAASAEHRYFLVFGWVEVRLDVLGKLAK